MTSLPPSCRATKDLARVVELFISQDRPALEEQFLTKDSYRKQELHSLEECFDYYERKNAE